MPSTKFDLHFRRCVCAAMLLLLAAGCARLPDIGTTRLRSETLGNLQRQLLDRRPDVDQFRLRGPFDVTVREDIAFVLDGGERVVGDLYLSALPEKAPLVILLHGHANSKDDHAYQAYHLATWGLHGLAIDLPNEGPWLDNGKILARVTSQVARRVSALDARIDAGRIVLAGHSFGAAAVAVALGEGAPAVGGILLDPASTFRELQRYLERIRTPVMIVAADARSSMTQRRDDFFFFIPRNVFEVSVADAHHEDAQFAFDSGLGLFDDAHATREHQITFASALTAAAFSIALTGGLDYAWASVADAVQAGRLLDRMRK